MKHLKKFNESISNNIVDDVYYILLELKDLGFKIKVEKEKDDDSHGKHPLHKKDSLLISIDGDNLTDDYRNHVREIILRVLEFLKIEKFKTVSLYKAINNEDYKINNFTELISNVKSIPHSIEFKVKN